MIASCDYPLPAAESSSSRDPAAHLEFSPSSPVRWSVPLPEYNELVAEAKKEIREIDAADLKNMQQTHDDFILIDVREPDEVAQGAITGAVAVPRGLIEYKIDTVTTDKDAKIVCYCGGGGRSALAARNLQRMGFKNVMSLAGGYKKWKESK
jgi:rhodanese-related sulfurtransferase